VGRRTAGWLGWKRPKKGAHASHLMLKGSFYTEGAQFPAMGACANKPNGSVLKRKNKGQELNRDRAHVRRETLLKNETADTLLNDGKTGVWLCKIT